MNKHWPKHGDLSTSVQRMFVSLRKLLIFTDSPWSLKISFAHFSNQPSISLMRLMKEALKCSPGTINQNEGALQIMKWLLLMEKPLVLECQLWLVKSSNIKMSGEASWGQIIWLQWPQRDVASLPIAESHCEKFTFTSVFGTWHDLRDVAQSFNCLDYYVLNYILHLLNHSEYKSH